VEVKVGNSSVSLQDTLRSAYYRAGSDVKFFFKGKLKGNGQDVTKELTHSEFSTPSESRLSYLHLSNGC
uniref:hypothetical protein n=1 Tax=Parabacteroides distasonis TaxID=823 RepID=UPI001E64F9BD